MCLTFQNENINGVLLNVKKSIIDINVFKIFILLIFILINKTNSKMTSRIFEINLVQCAIRIGSLAKIRRGEVVGSSRH